MNLFSLFKLTHENNEIKSPMKIYDFTVFIPICNTKQYIYKTDYALLHHSGTYNKVNIGIESTWM